MTKLITSVMCDAPAGAIEICRQALADGSDLVEIRLDGWDPPSETPEPLADALPGGRWIATCRSSEEGGSSRGDTVQRVSRLITAGRGGAAFVDFEFADWRRSANIRQKIRLATAPDGHDHDSRLILSSHDFRERPEDPSGLLQAMSAEKGVASAKLAWPARDIRDNLLAFDLMRDAKAPVMVICMGEAGLMSRVLARKLGAFGTYCAPATGAETAPGQITLDEMIRCYRWHSMNGSTRVFGVIGNPVAHSMSPALFNTCFDRHGLNAVYLPLLVEPGAGVLGGFLDGCLQRPWLDVGGFSVTVPHKRAVAVWLGERIDPPAGRIGAVNTLVPRDGTFQGYNTDYAGALDAVTEALDRTRSDLANLRVDVLGAGGVARAVVAGLRDGGACVTVYNRNAERAGALARDFDCQTGPWSQRHQSTRANLLINCTSVGMWPDVEQSPLEPKRLGGRPVVFDVVYNPVETRLLGEARQAGCHTIDGLTMFVHQAAAQFELWTGRKADKTLMRRIVEDNLRNASKPHVGHAF